MKRRTGLSWTKDLIRSSVAGGMIPMWRGATREVVAVAGSDLWTAKEAAGANARVHDEDERRPAIKRMDRFMVRVGLGGVSCCWCVYNVIYICVHNTKFYIMVDPATPYHGTSGRNRPRHRNRTRHY